MKHSAIALAAFVLITRSAAAQQSVLEVDADAYRYDASKAQIELYYGVLQRALSFKQTGKSWQAKIDANAEVWQNNKLIAAQPIAKTMLYDVSRSALDSMGANKLLGGAVFTVPYGPNYVAALLWHAKDSTGKSLTDTLRIPVTIPDSDPTHFALGNLEIASSMDKSNGSNSPFEKAGYIVTPNPSAIFGENYTKLFYYSELYVPKASIDPAQMVEIVSRIVDATGREILATTQKQVLLGASLPVLGGLDIDGLAGDSYKLQVLIKQEGAVVAQAEKQFYYVSDIKLEEETPRPGAAALSEDALFALSDFSKLTETEADDRITQTLYVASEADRKQSKTLKSLSEKQRFLFGYWRKQDLSQINAKPLSMYDQFQDRVAQATRLYSYQKTIGWKSSRGRVYIKYGPPVYTHEELFNPAYRPYISWEYDANPALRLTSGSRAQFFFLDRQGGGNYVLVHSNVSGEVNEPDWMNREAYQLSK